MSQSPFDLFSSSPSKKGAAPKKKESAPTPQKFSSSDFDQLVQKIKSAKNMREDLEAAVIKGWLQKGRTLEEYELVKKYFRETPTGEVKKKLDQLAGQIAAVAGENVLPQHYRTKQATQKPLTDKQRKGKQLGAKKKWMPIP